QRLDFCAFPGFVRPLLKMKVIINKLPVFLFLESTKRMDDQTRKPFPNRLRLGCARKRLAENALGSVDICSCGTWQLHVGAVTLRFASPEMSELLSLLGNAIAEHSAWRYRTDDLEDPSFFPGRSGGSA